ncbi:MAG: oligosaccharide flippase family protein [Methanoregula sp.]
MTILTAPFITRLFGPEAFGVWAIFGSIVSIIVVITCMRYELSIVLPKSDDDAANLFAVCIMFTLIVSAITIPIVFFFGTEIASLLNVPQLAPHLWFLPLSVFIGGVSLPVYYWNARIKDFKRASVAQIVGSVSTTGTQLGSGIVGYGTAGILILAGIFGQFISILYVGISILKHDFRVFRDAIHVKKMVEGIKRYKQFPLVDSISALMNTTSTSLPIILLAVFYSPVIAGFYSLSIAVIQVPFFLVGNAISQAFFPHGTDAHREEKLFIIVEDLFKILLIVIAFPLLTIMIIGGDFFGVVFGNSWVEAGIFAQILCIFFLINFVTNPMTLIYIILEKQVFGLYFNIINFLTRLTVLLIGGLFFNVYIALILFALAGIFVYLFVLIQLMKYAKVRWKNIVQQLISVLLMFFPAGVLLIMLQVYIRNPYVTVLTASVFVVIYYLYILKTDKQVQNILMGCKF